MNNKDEEIVKLASDVFSDSKMPPKNNFIKTEVLKMEKRMFIFKILFIILGYICITLWLNAIRATTSLWFVWVLIIIQVTLYCLIFSVSYGRAKVCDFKYFGIIPFIILAALGRVENWELFIIPLTVVIMLIVSTRNKNVSSERQDLLKD